MTKYKQIKLNEVRASLVELRIKNKTSQEKFSFATGVTTSTITAMENGKRELTLMYVMDVCKFYNISISEFIKDLEV